MNRKFMSSTDISQKERHYPTVWCPDLNPDVQDHACFPMYKVNGKWLIIISKKDIELFANDVDAIILKELPQINS